MKVVSKFPKHVKQGSHIAVKDLFPFKRICDRYTMYAMFLSVSVQTTKLPLENNAYNTLKQQQ